MASSFISKPGTQNGPCEGSCHHTDCAGLRGMADAICPLCGFSIGYETHFYHLGKDSGKGANLDGKYVHAVCWEELHEPLEFRDALGFETERRILGCVLVGGRKVMGSVSFLEIDDFSHWQHAVIFRAMKQLYPSGNEINVTTVWAALKQVAFTSEVKEQHIKALADDVEIEDVNSLMLVIPTFKRHYQRQVEESRNSVPTKRPEFISLDKFRPGDVIRRHVETPDGEVIEVTMTLLYKKRDIKGGELWMVRRSDSRDHEFGHNFYHEATGEDGVSIVPRLYERIAQVPDVVPALPKGWQTKLGYTGRKDDGAWHRCVDIARRLYQEGLWNGVNAIEIKEPYKVHDLLFGVNPIPPQELTTDHYINHSRKPDVNPSHGGLPHIPAMPHEGEGFLDWESLDMDVEEPDYGEPPDLPPNYPFDDPWADFDVTTWKQNVHQEPDGTSPFMVENLYRDWEARVLSPIKPGMWVSGVSPNDYPDDKWQITDVTRHESNGRIECWYSNSGDFECLLAYADELQDCVTDPPTPAELLRFEIRSDRFEMEELCELMQAAQNAYTTKEKALEKKLRSLADLEGTDKGDVDGWASWFTWEGHRVAVVNEQKLAEEIS